MNDETRMKDVDQTNSNGGNDNAETRKFEQETGNKAGKGKNGKGKRGNGRGTGRGGKGTASDMSRRGGNDPRWHSYSPVLTALAANLPFGNATGVQFNLDNPVYPQPESLPGICAIGLRPSIGDAVDQNSALNIGANKLFTSIRTTLAGTFHFDAPDCMIYGLALTSIYSVIVFLQRIYGMHKKFDQMNRYISEALITACHVDPDDVRKNSAQLLFNINQMLARIASYNAPAFIDIFAFHAWLYRDVYIEGTSIKDQLYLYVPDGFWFFNLNPEDKAGMLEFKRMDAFLSNKPEGYLLTVADLTTYVNNMIDRLWFSEDFTTISAFMLKAYGSNNMIKVQELSPAYQTPIELNDYVLHQFKNATILPAEAAYFSGAGNIKQDPTHLYLMSNNTWTFDMASVPSEDTASFNKEGAAAAVYALLENKILTEDDAAPTPEMVIESTRHMVTATNLVNNLTWGGENNDELTGNLVFGLVSGSTIPVYCNYLIYTPNANGIGANLVTVRGQYAYVASANDDMETHSGETVLNYLRQYMSLVDIASKFKYHPMHSLYICEGTTQSADPKDWTYTYRIRDYEINNMTVIDFDEIRNLHEVALLSELDVPTANFKGSSNPQKK